MSAQILFGKPLVEKISAELAPRIEQFRQAHGVAPTLAVVRVGNSPAAVSYAHSIDRQFHRCGMGFQMEALPDDATADQIIARLRELDRIDSVHGIVLQRPLPPTIDARAVLAAFPSAKDVEGVSPINLGKLLLDLGDYFPTSAPSAAIEILNHYEIPIAGKRAVVVGRSDILGKPLALLLLRANATVSVCHSHTQNLADLTRQAELLFAAVGKPNMLTADMISRGAVVVDCGVNVVKENFVGDVAAASVKEVAAALTPVPGGTGPVTTMLLMRHTVRAAEQQAKQMGTKGRIRWLPTLKSPNKRK